MKKTPSNSRALVDRRPGERVVVTGVEGDPARINRLAALGILPGAELRVQQTRPVVIVESDETVLALEREVAADVVVVDLVEETARAAE